MVASLDELLENDGVLPLSADATIAVIGPNADSPRHLLGNYTYAAAESDESALDVVTPLEAIRDRLQTRSVRYERGCAVRVEDDATDGESRDFDAATAAARNADVVVACVGGRSGIDVERDATGTAGEGLDRTSLSLPGRQQGLLEAVAETGTPLVVVLVNGRPLSLASLDSPAAVLEAWLPGQAGGLAIADVLFGVVDATGRLPVSIPRSAGQLPVHYRRTPLSAKQGYVDEPADPWFPFGHGESYAAFEYANLEVESASVPIGGAIDLSLDVTNAADRSGVEVVQLYVRDREVSVTRPVRGTPRVPAPLAPARRASTGLVFAPD
ncbi:glycoside hydrolase family 3 C-terminal domain-containing protein [Natronosalvus caseinilyticus]|uniref:glycoside hydrolase family 3 C-terminal domain-containing protein n=1 Tax=Natronosalvus caseinilyticus TaxID=2953747 RepID=UPI0028B1D75B|nr:glycoside hydrolase family 3 C-terminal domain-containing protein [Natronosalvus caseinilyticus]